MNKVIVVGAGASGMAAAYAAAIEGAQVEILEKNEKAGKKLYITGKGRCNFTNAAEYDDFLASLFRGNDFFRSSFRAFDNHDLMDLMESAGCNYEIQRGGRVFPASSKASDVTKAWLKLLDSSGVKIRLNTPVLEIATEDGRVTGVKTPTGFEAADAVIVATGGLSYPSTGSTGDGYGFARKFGHRILTTRPALTGLNSPDSWVHELSGLTLKNVKVTLFSAGHMSLEDFGEMLFTHRGISGPAVLTLSCLVPEKSMPPWRVEIDLKPALDREVLSTRLSRDLASMGGRAARHCLDELMPKSLAQAVFAMSGINEDTACAQLKARERERLVDLMKALPVNISGAGSWDEAVITDGGVATDEVVPATMASKKLAGLYFAGELLAVHGFTGGYNLQIAFSTGMAAGRGAARQKSRTPE